MILTSKVGIISVVQVATDAPKVKWLEIGQQVWCRRMPGDSNQRGLSPTPPHLLPNQADFIGQRLLPAQQLPPCSPAGPGMLPRLLNRGLSPRVWLGVWEDVLLQPQQGRFRGHD